MINDTSSWFYDLCAYGMDLRLTEKERSQAYLPKLAMEKAIIYTNDLFSWAKEKSEQETVAASKDMFSAVAVLMKEYKISENEGLDLLRVKTIECEKEHWAAVADLEKSGPISENLYRYLDMTRLCHSGGMLWSALTDRYNRRGMDGETERASLPSTVIESSSKTRASSSSVSNGTALNGSIPDVVEINDHDVTNETIHWKDNAAKVHEPCFGGDAAEQGSHGQDAAADNVNGCDLSLKAHAKDVSLPTELKHEANTAIPE